MERKDPFEGLTIQSIRGYEKDGETLKERRYTLADFDGKTVNEFGYTKSQVEAILDFMKNGVYKGMFKKVQKNDYISALIMQYENRIRSAKKDEGNSLMSELKERLAVLEKFYEEENLIGKKSENKEAQPE